MPGDVVHVSGDAGPYTIDSPIIANLGVTVVGKRARRLRKARRCRRFVRRKGGFVRSGAAGANRFRFDGYLGGRRLKPGVYRMVAVPTDAAGNRGGRFRASFAIARG